LCYSLCSAYRRISLPLPSDVAIYHRVPQDLMLARTCTDSYVRSRADLQRLNYVDVQSSVAVRDSRQDQRRLTTSPFQSRRPPISTRRATTARRPLAGDSSGFQQTVQLTRQLCDPAAGSSPRPTCLDSHFTHLTGGMAVTR